MRWIWENSEKLGSLSQLITALIAGAALWLAVVQIRWARRSQREATAFQIFSEQLKQAFTQSKFANGDYDSGEEQAYDAFVSHLLYACENLVLLYIKDKEGTQEIKAATAEPYNYDRWMKTLSRVLGEDWHDFEQWVTAIKRNLEPHKKHLAERILPEQEQALTYAEFLVEIVKDVAAPQSTPAGRVTSSP